MESLISFFKELKYINWGYLEAYRKFTKISHRKERPFLCPIRFPGEILVSFIYKGIHFAVVRRRDFSVLYIPRHSLRRCTTAKFDL